MTSLIRPALNLNHYHFKRTIRGIHCFGTWLTHDDERGRTEPCLVLLDAKRRIAAGHTVPVIIPMNTAWIYAVSDDREIGDRQQAAISIMEWLTAGYLPNDFIAVLHAINECLRDLYNMPPKPREGVVPIGDIIIKDRLSGSTLKEAEITNDV